MIKVEDGKLKKDNKDKKSGLTPKQKELLITIAVLVASVVGGFFIGKILFEVLH